MAPGQTPSNHVHEIFGGDGFKADWDFDTAKNGKCNNMGPAKDHSNYWYPALYFHGADGSFTKVPTQFIVYYHFDTSDSGPRTMFPPGLKIVAGNAMLRHDDSATNKATKSIQWWCHGANEKKKFAGFPDGVTSCDGYNGFASEIWFPFCWDGVNEFDPKDPEAHVTYGDGDRPQGGKCPSSHPTPLPQLFAEFNHDVKQFVGKPGAKDPWVLAQGDPTGAGFHADFINGWEDGPGSLSEAIKVDPSDPKKTKCNVGLTGKGPAECFDMLPDDTKGNCKVQVVLDEDVTSPGNSLPGCNPIQGPSQQDATIQTNCAGYTAPTGGASSNTTTSDDDNSASSSVSSAPVLPSVTSTPPTAEKDTGTATSKPSSVAVANKQGYSYQGCYSDLIPSRSIRTLSTWGRGDSTTACITHCAAADFDFAGTEYGGQCFCGHEIEKIQAKKVDEGQCKTPCEGDTKEICGGTGAISIFQKAGKEKKSRGFRRHLGRHLERVRS